MDQELFTVVQNGGFVLLAFTSVVFWAAFAIGVTAVRLTNARDGRMWLILWLGGYIVVTAGCVGASWRQIQYRSWLRPGRHLSYVGALKDIRIDSRVDMGPKSHASWETDLVSVGGNRFPISCKHETLDPDAMVCMAPAKPGDILRVDYVQQGVLRILKLQSPTAAPR